MSEHDKALVTGFALVVAGLVATGYGVPFGGMVVLFGVGVIWWAL